MCTYQNHPGPHSSPNQSIILCNSIFNFRTFLYLVVVVFQLLSSFRLFGTPWTAAHQSSLSFTISQSLLKLMSIVSVMPSNRLILCHPLLLLPSVFPSIRVFSNESALCIRWPEHWSFSFSISPSNEYSGLISSFALCFYFMSPLRNCDLLKGKDHSLCIFYNLYRWTQ